MTPTAPRHLHIDRLELDLRGIDPALGQAAVNLLGPALARALAGYAGAPAPAQQIDAGHLASPAAPVPHELATGMAQRIAASLEGGKQ